MGRQDCAHQLSMEEAEQVADSRREAAVDRILQEYGDLFQSTIREWLIYHQRNIVLTRCTYMGIPAMKNPMDAWIYQEILHAVRPDVVIEIGSAAGGSTLYLAHLLQQLGDGIVVSVDRDRSTYRAEAVNIIDITGDSSSGEVVAAVSERCHGKTGLVIHDGDHTYQAVRKEMDLYAPLVTPGSYFIVEDGIVDLFPQGEMFFSGRGPLHAIVDFLADNPDFRVDSGRERYQLTYNPHGFLRRMGERQEPK